MNFKNKPTYSEGIEAFVVAIAVALAYYLLIIY